MYEIIWVPASIFLAGLAIMIYGSLYQVKSK